MSFNSLLFVSVVQPRSKSVLGILFVWACSTTDVHIFGGNATKLVLAYYTISVFLLMTLTCMICYRLVLRARTLKKNLGDGEERLHFSIVTLFIESVLPSTLTGIAFLVSYGVGSVPEVGFLHVYTVMMVRRWNLRLSIHKRRLVLTARFSVYVATGVDLTHCGGNCMAQRLNEAVIAHEVLFTRWRYVWLRTHRWECNGTRVNIWLARCIVKWI